MTTIATVVETELVFEVSEWGPNRERGNLINGWSSHVEIGRHGGSSSEVQAPVGMENGYYEKNHTFTEVDSTKYDLGFNTIVGVLKNIVT